MYLTQKNLSRTLCRYPVAEKKLTFSGHFIFLKLVLKNFSSPHSKNKCVVKCVIFTHYTRCQVCNWAKCILTKHCWLNVSGTKRYSVWKLNVTVVMCIENTYFKCLKNYYCDLRIKVTHLIVFKVIIWELGLKKIIIHFWCNFLD